MAKKPITLEDYEAFMSNLDKKAIVSDLKKKYTTKQKELNDIAGKIVELGGNDPRVGNGGGDSVGNGRRAAKPKSRKGGTRLKGDDLKALRERAKVLYSVSKDKALSKADAIRILEIEPSQWITATKGLTLTKANPTASKREGYKLYIK